MSYEDPWDWTRKEPAQAPLSNTLQYQPQPEMQPGQMVPNQEDPLLSMVKGRAMDKGLTAAENKVAGMFTPSAPLSTGTLTSTLPVNSIGIAGEAAAPGLTGALQPGALSVATQAAVPGLTAAAVPATTTALAPLDKINFLLSSERQEGPPPMAKNYFYSESSIKSTSFSPNISPASSRSASLRSSSSS